MKKRILAMLLVCLMVASLLTCAVAAANGGKIAADSRKGVVRVIALRPDGYYSLGTAFGVGTAGKQTDIFVTNHHVVNDEYDNPAINVWLLKNSNAWNPVTGLDTSQAIPCTVIYDEGAYPDMAILQAAEKPSDRVALPLLGNEKSLEVGDAVYALGYPASSDATEETVYGSAVVGGVEDVTVTDGLVSRFTTSPTFGNTRLVQHTAQINHGNSGGPLLDQNGAVVGINTYGLGMDATTGDDNSYYSVRIQYVLDVLDELDIHYETYRAKSGLGTGAIIAIVSAVAVVIVVAVVVLQKKKQPAHARQPVSANGYAPAQGGAQDSGLRIQALSGVFAGKRFSIAGQVRIGRDPSRNDLVYPAETQGISSVHCVLTFQSGQLFLTDVGSTYGTFLGTGARLAPSQPAALRIGDRFFLGSEQEMFVITGRGGL